jgi:UDP-glucose 4-epimerase
MNILITGGAGYIGSHIVEQLVNKNNIIIFDNLKTGHKKLINKKAIFIKGDIKNRKLLSVIIKRYNIQTIIHLAAFLNVTEAERKKLKYKINNILGTQNLIFACKNLNVRNLIFSSSCSIYGNIKGSVSERKKPNPQGYYAYTKFKGEELIKKYSKIYKFKYAILRYFNVAGAHPSRIIGENPINNTDNLFPSIFKSLKSKPLKIFGNDYLTRDGTAIRDYVHVMDIAKAHLNAINFLEKNKGFYVFNLGTNKESSVLSIINIFKKILKKNIPYLVYSKRIGDPDKSVASYKKANKFLKWKPNYSILQICRSSINYYKNFINKN